MQRKTNKISIDLFRRLICCFIILSGFWATIASAQTVIIGANNGTNSTTGYPCPIQHYYYSSRAQYLYTATELAAAGITNGASISQLGWVVNATSGTGHSQTNYTLFLKNTSTTSLSTSAWETGVTQVYGPTTYSYTSGYAGNVMFNTSSFVYTGGNLIVELCGGISTISYTFNPQCQWTTGLAFNGNHQWRADGVTGCGNASTTQTGTATTRPRLVITYTAGGACSGTPAPGNTMLTAGNNPTCSGLNFTLGLQNTTSGSGVTYQWQSSPDNTTWANFGGGGATQTTSQTVATYYRCLVTCSGNTGTSASLQVTMNPNTCQCLTYCTPNYTSYDGTDYIANFSIYDATDAIQLFTNSSGNTPLPGYQSYTGLSTTTLTGASTYHAHLTTGTSGNESVAIWIDYNADGTLSAGEQLGTTTGINGGTTLNYTFTVPSNVVAGNVRLRAVLNYAQNPVISCPNTSYGETEDYCVGLIAAPGCAGTPDPSSTVAPSSACSATSFNLSLSPAYALAALSYQWQSSPDNVTYTNIGGGTTQVYSTSQTASTWYRCLITCTNSGLSTLSAPSQVTMSGFLSCYCVPSHTFGTSGCFYGVVNNVTFNTLNHSPVCENVAPYYANNAPVGAATTSVIAGSTYPISINSGLYNYVGVWIDYNQSGTFDASEYIAITGSPNSSGSTWVGTASVAIPLTAVSGNTKMRINTEYYGYTMNSSLGCGPFTYGETEDYTITVIAPTACSGAPAGSTTVSSANPVCSSGLFTLSLGTAYTDGGLTFTWQSSPDGTTWTNTGGTGITYSTSQTTDTYYRCEVTCTNGGASIQSTSLLVTTNGDFCQCVTYCAATNQASACITNVSFNTLNNTTPGCENGPSYYTFETATTTVLAGATYTLSVTTDAGAIESVWIDYNHDGAFSASEWQQITTSSGTSTPTTLSITIPGGATPGSTRMRIRSRLTGNANGSGDACLAMGSGETEDYCITILLPIPCSGTPTPGNTVASVNPACATQNLTLSLQSNPPVTGFSYQWQTSPDNITWANAAGTAATYTVLQSTATYYRCEVTCSTGPATALSNPVLVGQAVCYCTTPVYSLNAALGDPCTDNAGLTNFTFAGINNTTTCNNSSPYFTYYPSAIASVQQSLTYSMSFTGGQPNYLTSFNIFIDYNDNGSYDDAGEQIVATGNVAGGPAPYSATYSVPLNAPLGTHRLRVRVSDAGITNSCSDDGIIGEVEDYLVTISGAPGCTGTPAPGATLSSTNLACSTQSISLSLQNLTPGTGVTYQWQSSPDNTTWSNIGGATASTASVTEVSDTYYRCEVTCSGNSAFSTEYLVYYSGPCYCTNPVYTSGPGCAFGFYINNVTFAGINNTSGCNGTPPYHHYYNLTATAQQGLSYPLSIAGVAPLGPLYYAVYIDYNDNGSFDDSGENIYISGDVQSTNPATTTIAIPLSATVGTHHMRVRSSFNAPPANSCSADGLYGEAEDYNITITGAPACSGTPNPGNTLTSDASVCADDVFTISLQNYPSGETGLSYAWQWSDDGGITWPPVPGIGNVPSFTYSQTSFWVYRCVVTCANGGASAISTPVTVNQNTASQCFCTPSYTSYDGTDYISNVTLNTLNNSSGATVLPGYIDYSPMGTNLVSGNAYSISITTGSQAGESVSAWIDYNLSGTFDAAEQLGQALSVPSFGLSTFNFTVPPTAAGTSRLRVVCMYAATTVIPCPTSGYGETEDYEIELGDPNCISLPTFPLNGGSACPGGLTLTWPSKAGATGYDVYLDAVDGTTNVSLGQPGTSYTPSTQLTPGGYFWRVIPQYSSGSCSAPQTWTFTALSMPDPAANSNAPICEGNPLGLTSSNNASGQSSGNGYSWTGPGFTSGSQNPSVTGSATSANSGTYIVTVTNGFGCSLTASTVVAVNPNPTGTAAVTGVSCVGLCDGGVVITPTAGLAPYIFTDGVTVNTDGIFTNAFCEGPASVDVFDDNGCTSTLPFSVGHISAAPPNINVAFPTVPAYACSGNSFTASTNPVNLATTYTWDGPAGTTFNTGGNPFATSTPTVTVNYGAPNGSGYNICVQAGNGCGSTNRRCSFVRGTVNVPGVIAPANNRTVECPSTSANYSIAAVTGATSYTWTITGNASVTGTGTSATVNFGAGWVSGNLCVTANTPCYSSATRCLALSRATAAPGAISGSATACPGASVTYSVPVSSGAATYNWVLPPNTTGSSSTNSILVSFLPGFSFGDIKISITSICGITSAQLVKTIASGLPATPASISGNLGGLCGQTTTYSCPSVPGATSYTWTTPGSINSGQGSTSINVTYGSFVNGTVCVKANNACGSGALRCVPVQGAPVAPGIITYSPNPICANQSGVDLQVAPVFGASTYSWTFPSGVAVVLDLGNEQIVNWGSVGGTVTVTAHNTCGSATKNQVIAIGCREIAPAVEVLSSEVTVYPNPAHDKITLQFNATEKTNYVLNLMDLSGRVINTANATAQKGINTSELDLSQLAKGVYVIELKSDLISKQIRVVVE